MAVKAKGLLLGATFEIIIEKVTNLMSIRCFGVHDASYDGPLARSGGAGKLNLNLTPS